MLTNQNQQRASSGSRDFLGRPLALVSAVLFLISSLFPLIAGLSKNTTSFPKWWGMLDVGLAFVLAILAFAIMVFNSKITREAADASYRTYRILTHGILVMCVVFFLFGDRIVWINCLTGFAWRAWLLLLCLACVVYRVRHGRLHPICQSWVVWVLAGFGIATVQSHK
jgi:succinate dehydrogenase hydrophobic anchor subunit